MAVTVAHAKVSAVADGANTSLIRPSDWNAAHVVTGLESSTYAWTGDHTFDTGTVTFNNYARFPENEGIRCAGSGGKVLTFKDSGDANANYLSITNSTFVSEIVIKANSGISSHVPISIRPAGSDSVRFEWDAGEEFVGIELLNDAPGQGSTIGFVNANATQSAVQGGLSVGGGAGFCGAQYIGWVSGFGTTKSQFQFYTHDDGSFFLGDDGMKVGAPTGGYMGVDTVNVAAGYYENGVRLQPPKVVALADGATPALNAALGTVFYLDAAGDRTIAVPTNAVDGQKITIRHFANGGARTLSLNAGAGGFRFGTTITGLTATGSGLMDYIDCIYNGVDSFWDVVAYAKGF